MLHFSGDVVWLVVLLLLEPLPRQRADVLLQRAGAMLSTRLLKHRHERMPPQGNGKGEDRPRFVLQQRRLHFRLRNNRNRFHCWRVYER